MLLDRFGDGKIDQDSFKIFWQNYVYMYAYVLHDPLKFDVHSSDLINSTFDYIANIRVKPTERPKYVFEKEDLYEAKEKSP